MLRNLPMECAGVFLISTEGALFGPSKYGLLPELLPEQRLSWGNGIIELGTFLASIRGTMAAGYSGRALPRPRDDRRFSAAGVHVRRLRHQPRHFARPGRRSGEEISLESAGRLRRAVQDHPRRPGSRLGRPRQYLSLLSRRAAAVHDRDLRPRRAAHRRRAHQLPAGRRRRSASASAARRGISFRRKNRIWADPARRHRHDRLFGALLYQPGQRSLSSVDRILRCSDSSADFSPCRSTR